MKDISAVKVSVMWAASSTPAFSSGTGAHGVQARDYHKLSIFLCLGGFHGALRALLQSPKPFLQLSNILKQATVWVTVNLVGAVACCVVNLCVSRTTSYPCLQLQWCRTSPRWPCPVPRCCALMFSPMLWSLTGPGEMGCSDKPL